MSGLFSLHAVRLSCGVKVLCDRVKVPVYHDGTAVRMKILRGTDDDQFEPEVLTGETRAESTFVRMLTLADPTLEPSEQANCVIEFTEWLCESLVKSRPDCSTKESQRRIVLPPGSTLMRISRVFLTKAAHARVVEPVIRDMQHEYIEAIAEGHKWHALWIAFRGHFLVAPGWLFAAIIRAVSTIRSAR